MRSVERNANPALVAVIVGDETASSGRPFGGRSLKAARVAELMSDRWSGRAAGAPCSTRLGSADQKRMAIRTESAPLC